MVMSSVTSAGFLCASGLSTQVKWDEALREAVGAAREAIGGNVYVGMVFVSPHHAAAADEIAAEAGRMLDTTHVLGCTGECIAGTGREIEEEPAISVWL